MHSFKNLGGTAVSAKTFHDDGAAELRITVLIPGPNGGKRVDFHIFDAAQLGTISVSDLIAVAASDSVTGSQKIELGPGNAGDVPAKAQTAEAGQVASLQAQNTALQAEVTALKAQIAAKPPAPAGT